MRASARCWKPLSRMHRARISSWMSGTPGHRLVRLDAGTVRPVGPALLVQPEVDALHVGHGRQSATEILWGRLENIAHRPVLVFHTFSHSLCKTFGPGGHAQVDPVLGPGQQGPHHVEAPLGDLPVAQSLPVKAQVALNPLPGTHHLVVREPGDGALPYENDAPFALSS